MRDSHEWQIHSWGRHKLRGTGASFFPPVCTQLTTSIQIAAGIIALLNGYQISRDKRPLGFLNPWLYGEVLAGFNDITSGSKPGCDTN